MLFNYSVVNECHTYLFIYLSVLVESCDSCVTSIVYQFFLYCVIYPFLFKSEWNLFTYNLIYVCSQVSRHRHRHRHRGRKEQPYNYITTHTDTQTDKCKHRTQPSIFLSRTQTDTQTDKQEVAWVGNCNWPLAASLFFYAYRWDKKKKR